MNRILTPLELKIVQDFRALNPRNETQLKSLGLELNYVGDGLYRTAYQIVGTELVVKVKRNRTEFGEEQAQVHGETEIRVWKKLLRSKYASMVPPLRYYNDEGVIVTDFVKPQRSTDEETREKLTNWKMSLSSAFDVVSSDMHQGNIGVYNDRFVVLDLGHFTDWDRI